MSDFPTRLSTFIPQKPHIFTLIIHHGPSETTERLTSQLQHIRGKKEYIVIINHSTTALNIPQQVNTTVITQENTGYAGGIKTGLRYIEKNLKAHPEDIVVVLNNDGTVLDNFFQSLREWWQQQTKETLAGTKMSAVNLISGRSHIEHIPAHQWEIPYVHGALLSARLKTFKKIKLPTSFFLYWEDVALSQRAVAANIALKTLPGDIFSHNDRVKKISSQKLYYLARNGAAFLEHESPGIWPAWWKVANQARSLYHSTLGKQVVAKALKDRHQAYE